jgi:hypothetical protein
MVKPANTEKLLEATGMAWPDWINWLDAKKAFDLPHPEIARLITGAGKADGWRAQTITVAYEQHIGRRLPGQRADGRFNASVSRTLTGAAEELFQAWCVLMEPVTDLAGLTRKGVPATSRTRMGLNWRCKTEDGSYFVITFSETAPGKTKASAGHEGLLEAANVGPAKEFWGRKLIELKALSNLES